MNRDSGTMRGKRTVWGGRAPVRAVRYMAALVGIKHTPAIAPFDARLRAAGKPGSREAGKPGSREAGKPFKVAATACMRKLLTILNAMVHHNRRWDPQLT